MAHEELIRRQISEGRLQIFYNDVLISDKPVPRNWKMTACGFAGVVNKSEMATLMELRHEFLKQRIQKRVSVSTQELPPIEVQE